MPLAVRMELPALLLALDHVGRDILPARLHSIRCETRTIHCDDIRDERIKEPLLVVAAAGLRIIVTELAELLAGFDTELNAAIPQHLARLSLMDFGVDIERGEQRIKRRSRRVHEE